MRNIVLVIPVIVFVSCKNEIPNTDDPLIDNGDSAMHYSFPIEQIGKGKTFVYRPAGTKDADMYKDIQLIDDNENQYLVSKLRTDFINFDFSKSTLDGALAENYTYISLAPLPQFLPPFSAPDGYLTLQYDSFSPIKGEILEDTVFDTGKKIKNRSTKIVYIQRDSVLTYDDEEEYLKDTIFTWQGKTYDCIVTAIKRTTEFSSKAYPSKKHTLYESGTYYFAKGIGLVRYTNQRNDKFEVVELVEINEYSRRNNIMP
jgi:hypothetical protein